MRKTKKLFISIILIAAMIIAVLPLSRVMAEEEPEAILPEAGYNLNSYLIKSTYLAATDNGYMRVFHNADNVFVEYYDGDFNLLSKRSIALELAIFGGFFAGNDAYYLIEGQNNTEENDAAEVFRVIKYSKSWERLGAASITKSSVWGSEVRYPFHAANCNAVEYNGKLYIVTAHEGYVDPMYNQGHQGYLMIVVDETSMTGEIPDADLWHSFSQYIAIEDDEIYVLEQSEGSRYTKLSNCSLAGKRTQQTAILEYGGTHTSAWSIPCYSSVNGIAISSENVLTVGTSIDQAQYDNVTSDTPHNVYLTVTPRGSVQGASTNLIWLTDFVDGGASFAALNITKINNEKFLIAWNVTGETTDGSIISDYTTHFVIVDGSGNIVSSEKTLPIPLSDCQPIVNGSNVIFTASTTIQTGFYVYNTETGNLSSRIYNIAGPNAAWSLDGSVLTIKGSGPVTIPSQSVHRFSLSSIGGSVYYVVGPWNGLSEKITKIVVENGITSISERAFTGISALYEVVLGNDVESIGNEAFYGNLALRKVTVPYTASDIGKDIVWTGYYWVSDYSHVNYATIYSPKGSPAITYAKNNYIYYVELALGIDIKSAELPINDTITLTLSNALFRASDITWKTGNGTIVGIESVSEDSQKVTIKGIKYGKPVTVSATAGGQTVSAKIQTRFWDVAGSSDKNAANYQYFFTPVYWAADKGITNGFQTDDYIGTEKYGSFGADDDCTRGQLMVFLWRLAGKPSTEGIENPFSDVSEEALGSTYYNAILWGSDQGITKGYEDGTFRPGDTVIRKDIMIMLYRFAGKPSFTDKKGMNFTDVVGVYGKTSDTYKAISWGYNLGITNGYSSGEYAGQFGCSLPCLRKDIVTFLYRYAK